MANAATVIAVNLVRLRTRAGLSQHDLHRATGVSRSIIIDLERGTGSSSTTTLERLAAGLGVEWSELVRPLRAARRSSRGSSSNTDRS